ncbi:hypothetical protein FGG08_002260 [Glutinoglossum americanum]|uniref:Uncharacterized protein n=1 Tax=Glutinoglossum americanum TaxID=1670608 RepID=A0A9P8I6L5_9PEZI|nr:hypothetical protein FGG08_002260 [Glutinoglossum americanum]
MDDPTAYIPWAWSVGSTDPNAVTCPPPSAILGTFAIVNLIVGFLSITVGHRRVTKCLTCKLFGHKNSNSWKWVWIVVVGLQLLANACIALVIKRTPGYEQGFSIWQLTLFFTARPRVSWIFGIPFSWMPNCCSGARDRRARKDAAYQMYQGHNTSSQSQISPGQKFEKDWAWRTFAFSQFIAEIVLQLITAYTMGTTVAFAAPRGYYILGNLPGPTGRRAHMMYSAALYWLCGQSALLGLGLIVTVAVLASSWHVAYKMHFTMSVMGVAMVPLSWMATWLFWVGYVQLAGGL